MSHCGSYRGIGCNAAFCALARAAPNGQRKSVGDGSLYPMKQILLLEDDAGVSGVLAGLLEEEKYYVSTTTHVATRESFSKG